VWHGFAVARSSLASNLSFDFLKETTIVNTINNSEFRPGFARPGWLNRGEYAPGGERLRSMPPARHAAWSLYALATLVLLVTIIMTLGSDAATCTGAARPGAARHHARIETCAPTENPRVPGGR